MALDGSIGDLNTQRTRPGISERDSSHQSVGSAIALTPRQVQVLQCVEQSIEARGYPPTLREIGERLGMTSTNAVNDHLQRTAIEARGMRVLRSSSEATLAARGAGGRFCPHCGMVA
jgi:2-polyprenyl-6-methoxyphenol hydroxylase-like FAD-dependent oxidoreductase